MALIKSPCKDCTDRRTLCHSECERYISFRKRLDEINAEQLNEKRIEGYAIDQAHKSIKRRNKKG